MSEYSICKKNHVCPSCSMPVKPGHIYCPYHEQIRKEASRRYYYKTKERAKNDPKLREHLKKISDKGRKSYRNKHKRNGICVACNRPATHGVFCDKHWKYNIEHASNNPYVRRDTKHPKLSIPDVPRARVDVGKIIALYNAGWSINKICDEMKIGSTTVCRYIHIAKTEDSNE